ncbi:hypothetical protein GGD65_006094 [Bradyrhizobium sp. CIR18]|nr:hypothetical protein [Bradyrhizobium sp. CIR18]
MRKAPIAAVDEPKPKTLNPKTLNPKTLKPKTPQTQDSQRRRA